MVKSVDFAVRDLAGGVSHGAVAGDNAGNFIQVGAGDEISLNLRRYNILKYEQVGSDLKVVLVDGREITLSGYFSQPEGQEAQLYISADGEIAAVSLEDMGDGVLFANYSTPEVIGKWSPNDQLAFLDGEDIIPPATDDDTTGMAAFAPALFGGAGAAGLAGAGLVGASLLGGGGDGSGGGAGDGTITPTVDNPESDSTLTTETTDPAATVTGTGEPGSTVTVVLGDQTLETTVGEDGTWGVTFEDETFPSDGDLSAEVTVTAPDGTTYDLDGPDFLIDMTPPEVAVTEGAASTSDIENLEEYADGISISGTGEAGASISVEVRGETQTTTVAEDGSWSVTFTQDQLPAGTYTEDMTITATDINGNVTVLNDQLQVDTEPHPITFNAVTGDDVVNFAEQSAAGGVTVGGTSTPGATLHLTLGETTLPVTVGADGSWSATFTGAQIGSGTRDLTLTATTTDAAGNASSASHSFRLDTEVQNLSATTATPNSMIADNVVNHAEAAGGLVVTGTVEAGSTVTVQLANGTPVQAQVTGTTWTATIPAGALPAGEYNDVALTVRATDAYGNTASQTSQIDFDTVVRDFAVNTQIAGDGIVNASEAANGFAITGTVEAGSQVVVELASGATQTVTADASGNWSVTFGQSDLQGLSGSVAYTVTATDAAGNTAALNNASTQNFTFDLEAPDAPLITDKTDDGVSTRALYTSESEGDHFTISTVATDGSVATVLDANPVSLGSEDLYDFGSAGRVPNGSYLVVTDTDAAGNEASTLLVVDGNNDVTFDLSNSGLSNFDFGSIDLSYAQASLTITEEQILSLTGAENTLVISGDANDSVTALGAQDTGQDTVVGGQTHSIYTVGDDGATLLIDDQITNLTI